MKILVNDFRSQWLETRGDTLEAVEAVGDGGWYILGSEVRTFEEELAKAWGIKHAMPVFCDVDPHGLVDLDLCEAAFHQDRSIRYFAPVHLYGHSLDVDRLAQIRDKFELWVVEDCAQSVLASHNGRLTGTAGQMAATSFYPTKNLGALGDGGAILTNYDPAATLSRTLRDYGQSGKYQHEVIGYNSRLDELQAAILRRAHFPRLKRWTARRQEIARAYGEGIQHPGIAAPGAPSGSESCWHLYPIFVSPERKSAFIEHMREREIGIGEHYPIPIFDQAALQSVKYEIRGGVARASLLSRSEVSLPIHPYLCDVDVATVIEACNGWDG
jgi:dTDP-4-amino-4,6-dideoxygalactose transaminase